MDIDVLIEDARWNAIDLNKLAQNALSETLAFLGIASDYVEVSVLACDDRRIAALNRDHRGKSSPTNVLSWPAENLGAAEDGARPIPPTPDPDGTLALGDLALAYETCSRESVEQKKLMSDHVTHLIVHGSLHLLGYDHQRDSDATLMEDIERKILGKMGLDDPYME